jgi:DNA-binding CsgD family transcriptional regulator
MFAGNDRSTTDLMNRFNESYCRFLLETQLLKANFLQLRQLSDVVREAVAGYTGPRQQSAPPLTARLVQVVRLVSLGCTNTEIGLILHLSESTVDNYRTRAMKLMGAHCSASLTRLALKHGFTSLQDELTADERKVLDQSRRDNGKNPANGPYEIRMA